MKNLLVPVDFSETTAAVVEHAARLAAGFGSKVWIVHVAAPDPDFVGYEAGPESVRDQRAGELRAEHRELQALAAGLQGRGLDATALLVQGPTVETIVAEAERLEAEAIVMGSHGFGPVRRALVGSVSDGVLRRAAVPVLVVPSRRARG